MFFIAGKLSFCILIILVSRQPSADSSLPKAVFDPRYVNWQVCDASTQGDLTSKLQILCVLIPTVFLPFECLMNVTHSSSPSCQNPDLFTWPQRSCFHPQHSLSRESSKTHRAHSCLLFPIANPIPFCTHCFLVLLSAASCIIIRNCVISLTTEKM